MKKKHQIHLKYVYMNDRKLKTKYLPKEPLEAFRKDAIMRQWKEYTVSYLVYRRPHLC
jgi:hypothetical protein